MPEKHKEYLAANILSDGRIVTYRSLSRALKIHVNNAKEFLYEFHQQQNSKKPGSVHATYLLSGVRKSPPPPEVKHNGIKHDEDEEMQSLSFLSSSMPQQDERSEKTIVKSITLVREEDLENARAAFETITSIHIYSLQPHALKDLQVLSNVNREVYSQYANEDPLEVGRQYGTIINPNVKRRSGRRPPVVPQAPAPSKSSTGAGKENKNAKTELKEASIKSSNGINVESKPNDQSARPPQTKAENGTSTKPAPMKRGNSSIFKAFAKTRPKAQREDTDSSAAGSAQPSAPEDEPMKDVSEEEQEEDLVLPTSTKAAAAREAELKAKAQREEQLRQMMDVDDDEPSEPPEQSAASKEQSPENQPCPAVIKEPSPVPSKPGRRRGRRKIMKKITMKDEEGYLVTKEEPVWESFSEDEPPLQPQTSSRPKMTAASTQSSSAPTGGGTASRSKKGKPGQGNIKSFFSKR